MIGGLKHQLKFGLHARNDASLTAQWAQAASALHSAYASSVKTGVRNPNISDIFVKGLSSFTIHTK